MTASLFKRGRRTAPPLRPLRDLLLVLQMVAPASFLISVIILILLGVQSGVYAASTSNSNAGSEQLSTGDPACEEQQARLSCSYRRAWQLVRDNTMFPERLAEWKQWEHYFDGQLKNDHDLEEAITKMLASLGDQYTYFRNASETELWRTHDEDSSVVSACRLPHNIVYVKINSFASVHTASELESALQQFANPEGFIIDLRSNKGGYVEQALASFELMAEEGRFVSMDGREDGKPYHEVLSLQQTCLKRVVNGRTYTEARRKNLCAAKPIVVLVSDDTRSAAEMLAGALRDTRQAKLVGTRTFGKGVVQSCWNLEPGCSIKIAMAHYYLPSGTDINGSGIVPNFHVDFQKEGKTKEFEPHGLAATDFSRLESILPHIIHNWL